MTIKQFENYADELAAFEMTEILTIIEMLKREIEVRNLDADEARSFLLGRLSRPMRDIFDRSTPRGAAQGKFLDALSSRSPRVRMRFARLATEISNQCPDAAKFVAENSDDLDKKIKWYKIGRNDSRWIIEQSFIKDKPGMLSEFTSSRIFLRCSFRLAQGLLLAGDFDSVFSIYEELLELDQVDVLRIRHHKVLAYLFSGQYEDGLRYIETVSDNQNLLYKYCKAILAFLKEGDSFNAIIAANEAFWFDQRLMQALDTVTFTNDSFLKVFVDSDGFTECPKESLDLVIYCLVKLLPVLKLGETKNWLKVRYEKWQKSARFVESVSKATLVSPEESNAAVSSSLRLVHSAQCTPTF